MMRYILGFIILLSVAVAGNLNKLENSYIVKAEAIEKEKQVALNASDNKIAVLTAKLNKIYLASMKKKLLSEKENGNFNGAVEADKLIKQYNETGKVQSEAPKTASLKKLYDAYNSKKSEIEESVNKASVEATYTSKSRKLAQSYIFSLKKLLKLETKTGTLESAKAINDKINEMESLLDGGQVAKATDNSGKETISVLGSWKQQHRIGKIYTLYPDNTVTISNVPNKKFKWSVKDGKVYFDWSNGNIDAYTITKDALINGKSKAGHSIYNYKRVIAPITSADRFIGKWRRAKNPKDIYTFDKSGVVTLAGFRGTWRVSSPTSITITWSHRSNKDIHVLSADGKSLIWNGGIVSIKITIDPIVGEWTWMDKHRVILSVDGTATSSEGSTVTWETSGLNKYSVTWKKGNSTLIDYLLLSPDGTMLSGKNNRGKKMWASKVKLHPHWDGAKKESKYTLHLIDGVALLTNNGRESATGKWTISNGVVTIKWEDGTSTTYKIQKNKMIDNSGSTWIPIIKNPIKPIKLYPSKWEALKSKIAVLHLIDSTDCRIIINGKAGLGGKWTESKGVINLTWNNGAKETFIIHGNKITDKHGRIWFRQEDN